MQAFDSTLDNRNLSLPRMACPLPAWNRPRDTD